MNISIISALPGPRTIDLPADATYADVITAISAEWYDYHDTAVLSFHDLACADGWRHVFPEDRHQPLDGADTLFVSSGILHTDPGGPVRWTANGYEPYHRQST